jgi:hypothetical protein
MVSSTTTVSLARSFKDIAQLVSFFATGRGRMTEKIPTK